MIFDILSPHWIVQAIIVVSIAAVCLMALLKRAHENKMNSEHLQEAETHPRNMEAARQQNEAKLELAKLETSVSLAKYGAEEWKSKNQAIEHKP